MTDANFDKVWWMGKIFITSSTCGGSILVDGGGLHSFTLQLNASPFYGIGGAFWGYLGGVYEVSGGFRGCVRVINGSS